MNNIFQIGLIIISGFFLINCGGGGGGTSVNGVTLPTCDSGTSDYSGCWVSELCATNTGGASARLLTEVIETTTTPITTGHINSYLLEFSDPQCSGIPITVTQLNSVNSGNYHEAYVQQADTICSETGGTTGIPCEALDITITSQTLNTTGLTTLLVTSGTRLCMPELDYNFDTSGSGSMQAQSTSSRDDVINILPNSCAVRF